MHGHECKGMSSWGRNILHTLKISHKLNLKNVFFVKIFLTHFQTLHVILAALLFFKET